MNKLKNMFNSIFKKPDNQKEAHAPQLPESPYKISYNPIGDLQDGTFQVELENNDPFNPKTYNTTHIDICKEPIIVENHALYNCGLSWHKADDCMIYDPENLNHILPERHVLIELDWALLQQDPNYCIALLDKLCDKPRVEEYIERGLQEEPAEKPCGNYIGGIKKNEKGYTKFFNPSVGDSVHNSSAMVTQRTTHKQSLEARKLNAIFSKQQEIARLQNEIKDLER